MPSHRAHSPAGSRRRRYAALAASVVTVVIAGRGWILLSHRGPPATTTAANHGRVGEGGPAGDTTAAITQRAVGLTQDMLEEKPPDGGHRLNLLSSAFTHVGIAIYRSADGTVWMTQGFAS